MNKFFVPQLDDLSLTNSGLLYQFLRKVGLAQSTQKGYLQRSLVIIGLTWLPLLILTIVQGLAWGDKVEANFLKDIATHARFLIILPLLIFAEASVDSRIRELTIQFFRSGILTEKNEAAFNDIRKTVIRMTHSSKVDFVILVIIVVIISGRWTEAPEGLSYWMQEPTTRTISLAGMWNIIISLPLFQFILVRWFWRWCCWFYYFYKISKLPLSLHPAHPDLSGGLGFLGMPPSPFMMVNFAMAALCAAVAAERIIFMDHKLADFYVILGTLAVITVLMNVLPLLVFIKPLAAARRKGIFEYSALVQQHHMEFDQELLRGDKKTSLLGNPAASSMADINGSFDTIMKMRVFPFDLKIMASSILIVGIPILPLLAFEYNLVDILKKILSMLL